MDLHILKMKKNEGDQFNYTDYALLSNDIKNWFMKNLSAKYSIDKKSVVFNFDGRDYAVENNYDLDIFGLLEGVEYGDIVIFDFNEEKEITTKIGIGFLFEKVVQSVFFGNVDAKVNFDGKAFHLTNYAFTFNDEYFR